MLNNMLLLVLAYVLGHLFIASIILLLVTSLLLLFKKALLRFRLEIPKMNLLNAKLLNDCLNKPYLKTLFVLKLNSSRSKRYSPLL